MTNKHKCETPRQLRLTGLHGFKNPVIFAPCYSTGHRMALNPTDTDGMEGAGQLCPIYARIQTMARATIRLSVAFNQFFEQLKP